MFLVTVVLLAFLLSCEDKDIDSTGIKWHKSFAEAMSLAKDTGKPLFLYFSAVWCSWCREYERELAELSTFINSSFVPLQLDSDRDRKIFLNLGGRGTPFTVLIDPRGRVVLKFHGSIRAGELREVLLTAFRGIVVEEDDSEEFTIESVNRNTYIFLREYFIEDLRSRYDGSMGGFSSPSERGKVFKWPTPITYAYLIESGVMEDEALFSLRKDIEFLYDPVDGGFFNFYDRTRAYDFHFETSKSLSVNASMLIALLKAYRHTGEKLFLDTALDTYRYIKRFLQEPLSGCFYNAQLSEPSYYNLPPEKRKRSNPPPPDTAVVTEYNSLTVIALLELYDLLKREEFLKTAENCMNYILGKLYREGNVYRYIDMSSGEVGGLNFERDLSFLALSLAKLSRYRENYLKPLQKIVETQSKFDDWVSAGIMSYALSLYDVGSARSLLKGIQVNLSYHNPDDMVFLLKAIENVIERGDR